MITIFAVMEKGKNDMKYDSCKYWDKELDEYPCNKCIHNAIEHFKPMTNIERIKAMSVEELADFICDIYASNEHREIRVNGKWMHPEDVEEWLESEVEDEQREITDKRSQE